MAAASTSNASIGEAWKFVLSFAAGAGVTWFLSWFWWRINAWSEIVAMVASGELATWLTLAHPDLAYTTRLMWVVGLSTVAWLVATLATAPVSDTRLLEFLRRVRLGSPGWARLARAHNIEQPPYLARGVIDWLLAVAALFGVNGAIGQALLGDGTTAALMTVLAAAAGTVLAIRIRNQRRVASQ